LAKVTGIGGVFFKAQGDKQALASWYRTHLGFELEDFGGAILNWQNDVAEDKGLTVWCLADNDSEWFSPSTSAFMINYRIDDMAGMIAQLTEGGVDILQGPESHENGKFAWIMDPEGNKVELWEPKNWDEKNKET
jgi:predicted enzyme related to lactoylglutathione lyase